MIEFGILCAFVGVLLVWAEIRDRLHTAKAVLGDYGPEPEKRPALHPQCDMNGCMCYSEVVDHETGGCRKVVHPQCEIHGCLINPGR